jgi:hypothetical protein
VITVNGVNLQTLGFHPLDRADWWGGALEQVDAASPVGLYRSVRASSFRTPPRSLGWRLLLDEAVQANRHAQLTALRRLFHLPAPGVDTLRYSQPGEAQIVLTDSPRVGYAVYHGDRAGLVGGTLYHTGHAEVSLELTMYDPAKYNATADEIAIPNSTPVAVPLGDLGSWWLLEVDGAATDPAMVVLADNAGVAGAELWRIETTGTVSGGHTLEIDGLRHALIYDNGTTRVDVTDTWLAAFDGFFRQLESAAVGQVWVQLTSGTGTLHVRKRWR